MTEQKETISLRVSQKLLTEMEDSLKGGRYENLSHFLRTAINDRLAFDNGPKAGFGPVISAELEFAPDEFSETMNKLPETINKMQKEIKRLKKRVRVLERQPIVICLMETDDEKEGA